VADVYQEGLVIATSKLTLEFDITVCKNSLGWVGWNSQVLSAYGHSS